jgi:hypothetical protein
MHTNMHSFTTRAELESLEKQLMHKKSKDPQ